jgi:hypothetical protein
MILTLTRPFKTMKDFIVPACLAIFSLFIGWFGRIKSKADKADVQSIVDGTMRGVKDRLYEVEEDVRKVKNNQELHNLDINNKFERMIEENLRQGETLKGQAEHISKVFDEIKQISLTLKDKQDKPQ